MKRASANAEPLKTFINISEASVITIFMMAPPPVQFSDNFLLVPLIRAALGCGYHAGGARLGCGEQQRKERMTVFSKGIRVLWNVGGEI